MDAGWILAIILVAGFGYFVYKRGKAAEKRGGGSGGGSGSQGDIPKDQFRP